MMAGRTSPPAQEELREHIAALRCYERQDISVDNRVGWIEGQIENDIKLFAVVKCSHHSIVIFANRLLAKICSIINVR